MDPASFSIQTHPIPLFSTAQVLCGFCTYLSHDPQDSFYVWSKPLLLPSFFHHQKRFFGPNSLASIRKLERVTAHILFFLLENVCSILWARPSTKLCFMLALLWHSILCPHECQDLVQPKCWALYKELLFKILNKWNCTEPIYVSACAMLDPSQYAYRMRGAHVGNTGFVCVLCTGNLRMHIKGEWERACWSCLPFAHFMWAWNCERCFPPNVYTWSRKRHTVQTHFSQ